MLNSCKKFSGFDKLPPHMAPCQFLYNFLLFQDFPASSRPSSSTSSSSSLHLWISYRQADSLQPPHFCCPHLTQPRPSTSCSVVPSPSSHHVCRVGAGSLPQGWEWGAGGRTRQTPGERCGGRVEPRHRAELPGGPCHLPALWPQEDHPLWWGQDVRYAQLYPPCTFVCDDEHNTKDQLT